MSQPAWVRINCKHAHELISARLDQPLPPLDRFKLWAHLRICDMCVRVDKQMRFMREAMRRLGQ